VTVSVFDAERDRLAEVVAGVARDATVDVPSRPSLASVS
jgi:hypothetical protein